MGGEKKDKNPLRTEHHRHASTTIRAKATIAACEEPYRAHSAKTQQCLKKSPPVHGPGALEVKDGLLLREAGPAAEAALLQLPGVREKVPGGRVGAIADPGREVYEGVLRVLGGVYEVDPDGGDEVGPPEVHLQPRGGLLLALARPVVPGLPKYSEDACWAQNFLKADPDSSYSNLLSMA